MSESDKSNPMVRTITHTKSGATFQVHDFGATLLSFTTASKKELLFISRDAKLDGSEPIRGGMNIVFPQCGQRMPDMPVDGFTRNHMWKLTRQFDNEHSAGVDYELDLSDVTDEESRGHGEWRLEGNEGCHLLYHIEIGPEQVFTTFTIVNTGDEDFHFQALMHTYFLVRDGAALDATQCYVTGLDGYHVTDKVTSEDYTLGDEPVIIDSHTDRVYMPEPMVHHDLRAEIGVGDGGKIKIQAKSHIRDRSVPTACVIWHPHDTHKDFHDFGDEQHVDMICVEPGILDAEHSILGPGHRASLQQIIRVMS